MNILIRPVSLFFSSVSKRNSSKAPRSVHEDLLIGCSVYKKTNLRRMNGYIVHRRLLQRKTFSFLALDPPIRQIFLALFYGRPKQNCPTANSETKIEEQIHCPVEIGLSSLPGNSMNFVTNFLFVSCLTLILPLNLWHSEIKTLSSWVSLFDHQ